MFDTLRRVFAREKAPAPEVTVAKAKRYQELLIDPLFNELWADLALVIMRKMTTCSVRDQDGLVGLRMKLDNLYDLRRMAEKRVEQGKIEVYKDEVATKAAQFRSK